MSVSKNSNKRISRRSLTINPLEYQSYIWNLEIPGLFERKADVYSTLLKQLTIAAINDCYPEPEWLWVYTDSSKNRNAWSCWGRSYCRELAHYIPISSEVFLYSGWRLQCRLKATLFIYLFIFLHHLESPVMSTGSSQVGATLSPSF